VANIGRMRRLTHLVVLVAFVFSCGGQWAMFQCIAWANMIREYSEMVPLTQAVAMTFSGEYPCPICKAIAEKKTSEQQKTLALGKYEKKFLPLPLPLLGAVEVAGASFSFPELRVLLQSWSDSPAAPPPRFARV